MFPMVTTPPAPGRKASEVFLEFAAPVLDNAPKKLSRHKAQTMLDVLATIWNAVVVDEWNNNGEFVRELRRRMAAAPDAGAALIEPFLARKRELFADYKWAIGKVEVRAPRLPGRSFIIYVEARGNRS
jgi:hypothetical protein